MENFILSSLVRVSLLNRASGVLNNHESSWTFELNGPPYVCLVVTFSFVRDARWCLTQSWCFLENFIIKHSIECAVFVHLRSRQVWTGVICAGYLTAFARDVPWSSPVFMDRHLWYYPSCLEGGWTNQTGEEIVKRPLLGFSRFLAGISIKAVL